MTNLLEQGVLGIVTGILTTAILFLGKVSWSKKIRPMLHDMRYDGVRIEGAWQGTGEDKDQGWRTEMSLFLEQTATQISGTFVVNHKSDSAAYEAPFRTTGYIRDGYVILNFTPVDRRITSYATALMKISGGGFELQGQMTFRDINADQVTSEHVHLARKK